MGLFDFIPSLFGQKQNTEQNSTQSGTTNTQNNAWSQIQPFMQQYLQQYSPDKIAGAQTALNPYQYGAADNQAGVTAHLAPGYSAASGVAANGITPSSIQGFMSPYVQNVVDATRNDFNTQNARANAGVQAQASKLGALTGSQGTVAKNLAMESQRRQQDPIIAGLYNQGYGQAANTAAQSAGLQLQGAGTLGSLTGAQTGANVGLFQAGQGIYGAQNQQALQPFSLYSQGASSISPFTQAAGNTTNSSGTGSSTGTTQNNPGLIQSLMGLGGLGVAGYDYGQNKGWFADGGRVGRADGGAVSDLKPFHSEGGETFHDKVEKAFHVLHRMKSFSKGGMIEPYHADRHYADGGEIGPWETTLERAPAGPTANETLAKNLGDISKSFSQQPQRSMPWDMTGLTPFMASMAKAHGQGFADGGAPGSPEFPEPFYAGLRGVPAEGSVFPPYSAPDAEPPMRAGVPAPYRAARGAEPASSIAPQSANSQFAQILLAGSPISGSAGAMAEQQQRRISEEQNKRQADIERARIAQAENIAMGSIPGRGLTLAGRKNPAEIAALEAHSLPGMRSMKEFEYTTQKDLDALKDLRGLETKIDSAVMWGSITSEEGERRKQQARDLYERSRGMIREAPRPPVGTMLPPVPGVLGSPPPGAPPPGSTIILKGGTP